METPAQNPQPAAPPSPLPAPRKRWVSIVLALLVFVSGLAIGGAVTLAFVIHQARYAIHHPEQMPKRLAARLAGRLSLTAAQESQVREVIAKHQAKILHLRREVQPRVEVELRGVRDDVAALLDPQQCNEWNGIFADLMKNWVPELPAPTTVPAVPTTTPFPQQ